MATLFLGPALELKILYFSKLEPHHSCEVHNSYYFISLVIGFIVSEQQQCMGNQENLL